MHWPCRTPLIQVTVSDSSLDCAVTIRHAAVALPLPPALSERSESVRGVAVHGGRNAEGVAIGNRPAQQLHQRIANAVVRDGRGREK